MQYITRQDELQQTLQEIHDYVVFEMACGSRNTHIKSTYVEVILNQYRTMYVDVTDRHCSIKFFDATENRYTLIIDVPADRLFDALHVARYYVNNDGTEF